MLSLRTNLASIQISGSLKRNSKGLASSLEKVASGHRINQAADDAAGLATAVNLETQISSTRMAMRNANDGISIIQTAEGEVGSTIDVLQRMRELAIQAASGTVTSVERGYIATEFDQLKGSVKDKSKASEYNGILLLDGSSPTLSVQVGAGNGTNNRVDIEMADLRAVYFAMLSTSVTTDTGAQSALTDLDSAMQLLNSDRSKLGAVHNRLLSALDFSESYATALSSSMSAIIDTDFATETANLAKQQLLQAVSTSTLVQAKNINRDIIGLI
jgi:flagellin